MNKIHNLGNQISTRLRMLVILHGKDNLQQLVINICLSRVVPDYLLQCRVLQLHLCSQILLVAIRKNHRHQWEVGSRKSKNRQCKTKRKRHAMVQNTLHWRLKIEEYKSLKSRRWSQFPLKGRRFMSHQCHSWCNDTNIIWCKYHVGQQYA
jgi:hypothetical protein